MKPYRYLVIAIALLILPACDQNQNDNQSGGVKDAIGARPYEGVRDSAEDAGDAVNEGVQDFKDGVNAP